MKPRKIIEDMKEYKPTDSTGYIKLDANESSTGLTYSITSSDLNRYPDNNGTLLKEKLSEFLSIDKDHLVVGNGSSEMIELILKTYIEKEDIVMSFSPGFVMYKIFTEIYGGKYIGVDSKDGYMSDISDMIEAYNKYDPKVIFLCNPNNPTGYMISKSEIERLLKNVNCLVVVDEAYIDFADESMLNRLENYENLIILRTFSKAWRLAGARVGYMVASYNIINIISKVKSPYNINSFSQILGVKALENKKDICEGIKRSNALREELYKEMTKLNIKVYKSFANFLYFEESLELYDELIKEKILIRTFKNGKYRVTIGTEEENKLFLDGMKKYLNRNTYKEEII